MGPYRHFCAITVEHMFFAPDGTAEATGSRQTGICRDIDIVPYQHTAKRMANAGLLLRGAPGGVRLFYDEGRLDALSGVAAESQQGLALAFEIFARDPLFANYTQPSVPREGYVLYFTNRDAGSRDAGRPLHAADLVSEADFVPLNSPTIRELADQAIRRRNPLAVVDLVLPVAGGARNAVPAASPTEFHVRFATRETLWKYYLLGANTKTNSYITDLDEQTVFEPLGEETLADDSVALTFRSKGRIPLHHKFRRRFQYREQTTGSDKVLIKRLPVAAAEQIDREVVDGENAAVSSIYVSC